MSKRPKSQRRAFPLSFLSSALVQVLLALVEGIGTNKTARTMDISTPRYSEIVARTPDLLVFCFSFYLILPITLFMAPIPPLRRSGFQFRAEEIDDFLEIVETYLPISAQNWQTVADSHSENYPREQRTAESLHRKFQEISRRTGPTGDPTCPPYVIKAKAINRQLVQMIDASSDWWVGGRKE